MKNISINKSNMDPITTFDNIMKLKQDGKYKRKTIVLSLRNYLVQAYNQYEIALQNNKLETLTSSQIFQTNRDALISMYSYDDSELQKYKKELMSIGKFEDDECPLCQIDAINCFDHFVPKKQFPEFSINIHNLIPLCSICNNKKKEFFLENNKRKYINVYLDYIPKNQKFLKLKYDKDKIPIFFIYNFDNMDSDLYKKIENTFKDLLILQRYNKRMYKEIQSLRLLFKKIKLLPKIIIKQIINIRVIESENQNGDTHWKTMLYKELLTNDNLLEFIVNNN